MNSEHFNDLSPAEAERLALLAEECAETIQIVGKILRHGYDSTHPDNESGPCNREMLETELGHIAFAKKLMVDANDVLACEISKSKRKKAKTAPVYLHHQP